MGHKTRVVSRLTIKRLKVKTLFAIPVEAGRNITYSAGSVSRTIAVIPALEQEIEADDNNNEIITLSYKGCKPHLVRMTGELAAVKNVSGFRAVSQNITMELPIAVSVPMQNLMDKYYDRIKDILHNARTLSAYFNLNTLDIDQLGPARRTEEPLFHIMALPGNLFSIIGILFF